MACLLAEGETGWLRRWRGQAGSQDAPSSSPLHRTEQSAPGSLAASSTRDFPALAACQAANPKATAETHSWADLFVWFVFPVCECDSAEAGAQNQSRNRHGFRHYEGKTFTHFWPFKPFKPQILAKSTSLD